MALRELLAVFGLEFDASGMRKAEQGIDSVMGSIGKLQSLLVGSAVLAGFGKMVTMAADVGETMSVMNAVFKDSANEVVAWAEQQSAAVGRSEFKLREWASGMGAMLEPMLGSSKAAAKMSTELTQLAVDLGAFFNKADEDVIHDLRSAFAGSVETMQKYGIVMTEAAMQQFALEKGITKKINKMTQEEKAQLRFQYIMKMTRNAQGQALRESESFGNQLKGLKDAFTDLATELGGRFLGGATGLLTWLREGVLWFKNLARSTHIVEAALFALVPAIAAFLAPFLPAILSVLAFTLAASFLAFVLDDLWTNFVEGKPSVTGLIGEIIAGGEGFNELGTAIQFVVYLFGTFMNALQALVLAFTGDTETMKLVWDDFVEALGVAADFWFDPIKQALTDGLLWIWGWLSDVGTDMQAGFTKAMTAVGTALETAIKFWKDKLVGLVPDWLKNGFNAAASFMGAPAGGSSSSAAMGADGRSLQASPSGGNTVVTQQQNKFEMNLSQQPGEDSTGFMKRAEQRFKELLDESLESATHSLVQGVQ